MNDIEATPCRISVKENTDVPPTEEDPEDPSSGGGDMEYNYTFIVMESLSLGLMEVGNNEGYVIFEVDTDDPDVTAVEITVHDTSELNKGFFVSDGRPLPLPLQVKGGDVDAYQNLNRPEVVLTLPLLRDGSGGVAIDPIVLNQPVPDMNACLAGKYTIGLSFDGVFV